MLTDDIDADGAAASIPIFLGDFDGQGHKITGLRLTESCSEYDLFSRVESGASVRNLTVEGEVIPAGTQTDVGGIVGQMVPDITLRFSSGGLDELQTELNALQSLIKRTLDDAQSASDSVTGGAGVWTLTLPADGEESHTIRWRVPADGAKRYTVYTAADGGWKKAQTSTVGSYLCFALPSDSAQFAVVPAMHAAWQLWAAIAAALTAIAAVITLVIRKRRAKAAKRGWAILFQKDFALLDELICFGSGSGSAFLPCRRTGQASGCGQNCGHRSCAPQADPCPHP